MGRNGKIGDMKLFLGEYDHSLDERGRVTLPRKIRMELKDTVIILSRGFDPCIFGFDRRSWEIEAKRNLEESVKDVEGRRLRRYLFSAAEKVEVDKLGRILLPARLKEYAHITRDVVVVGAGDHIEIWDKTEWGTYASRLEDKLYG